MELPDLPVNRDLTYLGITTYRDKNQLFGIKRKDRRQHVYVLGKSGTGKSVLMFNMIIQNINNGEGVCVVDPHGELVEGVLSAIPPHRLKDVIYFNPADTDYHIGFNVLELMDPQYKHLVASGLMGIFTKIWANAWSARMEYILNNTILALLDTPGTTLLGIPRMLVDKDYRQKIIGNLKDPVIKAFWVHEYEAWQDKFRNEAIAPIQNKVGQFLSTSIIRNVVGQEKSTINIFDIMNEGKIFLVNVSKGRIGEDNSSLLGGMIITKVQLAAMERVRIPEENRKDFYLYVDEFQNFVTDAFASILSEARKYRLNLTVAHQYTAQLISDKSSAVRDAVFGNVGTMIIFRVGSDDADFLEKEFDPEFTPGDIVNLPNYKIYLKLMIDGVTSRPFSAKTLPPLAKSGNKEIENEVINSSRKLYCKPKEWVEDQINRWSGMSLGDIDNSGGSQGGSSGYASGSSSSGNGAFEKFPAICSLCKKETTVPFKPEPGRAVYCKECVAKIKSGEVKVEKGAENQVRYDDSKFYKPLADLGIEFAPKNSQENSSNIEENRHPERSNKSGPHPEHPEARKGGLLSAIKKAVVGPSPMKAKENPALKEIISKTMSGEIAPAVSRVPRTEFTNSTPPAISLSALKDKPKEVVVNSKDRAASADDMNKLKDLIQKAEKAPVTPEPKKEEVKPIPVVAPQPKVEVTLPPKPPVVSAPKVEIPLPPKPPISSTTPPSPQNLPIKEVPEEVLKKILEQ
ncbi:MAG: type IV secretion system DNA-binding domain-containing protein [Candidatus Pacebacteria bacterium]|nr:type IV secretion system DNA-binding domain-containing protein [Candidatus Paceibacterota bacterium]